MQVRPFSNVNQQQLFDFLSSEITHTADAAAENTWHSDWQKMPNTLPYILTQTDKFTGDNGEFYLLFDNEKIIAVGGVQLAHFNNKIAVAGIRTWVEKTQRNKMLVAKYLLPAHKAWAVAQGCKQIALTFNQYNRNLAKVFTRIRAGEAGDRISKRTSDMMFYNGVTELDFTVCIQYTPQWVIYEQLDPDWQFNWRAIRSI